MQIKKITLSILLALILLMTTGCVRGDIVLDLSRTGKAELSSKLMVVSFLKDNLKQIKEQFAQDGFEIMDVKEGSMEGFHAVRTFDSITDMKDLSLFRGLNVQDSLEKNKPQVPAARIASEQGDIQIIRTMRPAKLIVDHGVFFNTYKIDADIDLGSKYGFSKTDDSFIVKNIMSQVDLKFILKLPTKTLKNNAYQVSDDGRTLTWKLALGEDNQIVAELTMINLVSVGVLAIIILCLVTYLLLRRSGLWDKYFLKY